MPMNGALTTTSSSPPTSCGATTRRRPPRSPVRKSAEALARANRLAQRILQLGGRPSPKLTDVVGDATDKPFKLPKSMTDVHGVLRAILDAERTSLRTYHRLYARTRDGDP